MQIHVGTQTRKIKRHVGRRYIKCKDTPARRHLKYNCTQARKVYKHFSTQVRRMQGTQFSKLLPMFSGGKARDQWHEKEQGWAFFTINFLSFKFIKFNPLAKQNNLQKRSFENIYTDLKFVTIHLLPPYQMPYETSLKACFS